MGRALVAGALVAVTGAVVAVGVAVGRAPSPAGKGVNVTMGADKMALVVGRDGVRRLEVSRFAPGVEVTSVAPAHDRLRMPTALWAGGWKRLYGKSEPNAVVTYGRGAGVRRLSVSLASLRYNRARRTMVFTLRPMAPGVMTRPPLATTGTRALAGTRTELGPGQVYVDQTVDFGSNSATQDQNAFVALQQAGMGFTVTSQNYVCCAMGMQPPEIDNALPAGEAYDNLLVQPGTEATLTFTGAPAFGSASFTGLSNITFANGEDTDGATFGLTGPGAFSVASGSVLNFGLAPNAANGVGGTQNIVIYNGSFSNATLEGALGANSAIIGGTFTGTTFNDVVANDALIAGASFGGATFKSASGYTYFNDSALLGVNFEGATNSDALWFNGSALVPLSTPSPTGEPVVTPTSFANMDGGGQAFVFGPSLTNAASQSPIDGVNFSGMSGFDVAIASAVITNSNFSNASLGGNPTFKNSSIDNASNFTGTNFGQPLFESCSFNGTDLTNVTWFAPVFDGSAAAPTVLEGVVFNSSSFLAQSSGTYKGSFTNVTFNGTTFVGLSQANAADVAFISGIMKSTGVSTQDLGLIAFNTQYVLGADSTGTATWYQVNSTATEWTPIDSTTLEPTGPPQTNDPTVNPVPDGP